MTFLNHFHQGGHPRARPELGRRCEVHQPSSLALTAPLSHVVALWMIIALSSACAQSIEATAAVDRARRAQLIELAVCGRCPAKLSFLPAVTGHTWRENAPQSPQKMGVVDIARIPKAWPPRFDFGEEGRPSHDFSYFFHTFFTMGFS